MYAGDIIEDFIVLYIIFNNMHRINFYIILLCDCTGHFYMVF